MPPADPIALQLVDAVVTRLGALTQGATYHFTPGEVTRIIKVYTDVKAFPYYGVSFSQQDPQSPDLSNQEIEEHLTITIKIFVKDPDDFVSSLIKSYADITKSIHTDERWGNLALRTIPPSWLPDPNAITDDPMAGGTLQFQIVYDRARTAV